ncbi:hypothetical protein [Sphingobium sp.]|uniref:hypothetical protein n=1 Tax=Sphingobium sp. TaxID=1912891 RepID=UPI003B3B4038
MDMRFGLTGLAWLCCVSLVGTAAVAAKEKPRAESFEQLIACQSIGDATQRLACYDQRVADMKAGAEQDRLVVLDKAEIQKTRRSLFGFSLPKIPFLSGSDDDSEQESVNEVDASIVRVTTLPQGLWQLVLDDDSVWQTIEPVDIVSPKSGMPVHIRKAALGSYLGKINNRRPIRLKRVG